MRVSYIITDLIENYQPTALKTLNERVGHKTWWGSKEGKEGLGEEKSLNIASWAAAMDTV